MPNLSTGGRCPEGGPRASGAYAELIFDMRTRSRRRGLAPAEAEALLFSRSSTNAAGTTEVMRNILGEQVLGLLR